MRAVTFQAPGEVRRRGGPRAGAAASPTDAIVRIEATGVCGSDLHIYHGRVQIEPGFTIGHEYVGTVIAAGERRSRACAVGDRVLGCFQTACGRCFFCRARLVTTSATPRARSAMARRSASLQGTQAEQALVPNADLVLRRVPEG